MVNSAFDSQGLPIKVGMKVFLRCLESRQHKLYRVTSAIVTKVGNTYFYTDTVEASKVHCKFKICDHMEVPLNYDRYRLYFSLKELENEIEKNEITFKLESLFRDNRQFLDGLTLEQLKEIRAIIREAKLWEKL